MFCSCDLSLWMVLETRLVLGFTNRCRVQCKPVWFVSALTRFSFEHEGDGAVVLDVDLHVGAEDTGLDGESGIP